MKKIIKLLIIAGFLLLPIATTVPANAQLFDDAKDQACAGLQLSDGATCEEETGESGISTLLETVLNILSLVVGIIAVIMIIIAGVRFITSSGEGPNTAAARNTLIYALIGLVIVVISQFLVRFVINRVSAPPPAEEQSWIQQQQKTS